MIDLSRRATEPEQLDTGVSDSEARLSLRDLRFVNRFLGGRGSLLKAVDPYLSPRADGQPPRLLDVGCGSGDQPAALLRRHPALFAVGVDLKLLHLREAPAGLRKLVADVRRLPFGPASFEVVTASLFLHHFDGDEAADVLRSLYRLATRALVVSDLERAFVPYCFGRAAFPLLFRSRVSVNDGLLSIRRAFTPRELRAAFVAAGIPEARVGRRFPYRLLAVAERAP